MLSRTMRNPNSSLKPAINSGESVLSNIEQRGILQPLFIPLALLILTLVGLYFRLTYAMTTSPYIDEYTTMWVAQRTIQYGYPVFSTGAIYSQGMLFTYIDALFIHLFGLSKLVARMPSVILSAISIPFLYWVGRKLFSPWVGLIAAALLTFDPQAIIWGGRARNYALLLLMALLSTFLYYKGVIYREDRSYRRLSFLLLLGAVFTHNQASLLLPAYLLLALLRRGWRWFLRITVMVEHLLLIAGMAVSLELYRRLRPSGWTEVGEGRPPFGFSLNILKAIRRYKPFFVGPDHLPIVGFLTLLVILGLFYLYLTWRRQGRAITALAGEEGSLLFLYLLFGVLMLEMVFVVNERRWSYRYLFMLSPYFFLMASATLIKCLNLLVLHGRRLISPIQSPIPRRAYAPMLSGLAVAFIGVLCFPTAKSAAQSQEPGYDLAFQYVKRRWREGDKVMTFTSPPCMVYLGKCDYIAVELDFHSYAIKEGPYWIEAWGGIPILFTDEDLMEVIEKSPRIWFVVDDIRLHMRYTPQFIQYVWDHMELRANKRGVLVFLAQNPPPPGPTVGGSLNIELEGKVALLGYGLNGEAFKPGEEIRLSLRWKGLEPDLKSYSIFVHLLDANNTLWARDDSAPIGGLYPTDHWRVGESITDTHRLTLPTDIPVGRYRLEVGIYEPSTMEHLRATDGRERIVLDFLKVGLGKEEFMPQHPMEANLDDKVTWLGYDIISRRISPGDSIHLTLYWQAQRKMEKDYTVFVHLIDEEGQMWGQKDNQPEGGFYPTSHWDLGEVVKDRYEVLVEPDTPPGRYRLEIGMYLLATGERLPVLDEEGQPMDDRVLLDEVRVR